VAAAEPALDEAAALDERSRRSQASGSFRSPVLASLRDVGRLVEEHSRARQVCPSPRRGDAVEPVDLHRQESAPDWTSNESDAPIRMNTTLERQQGMHRRTRLVALGLMAALALGLATSQIWAQSPRAVSRDGQAKCVAVATGLEDRRCLVPGSGLRTWFRDCPVCPELVVVPAAPKDRRRKPFAVGRFAVTLEPTNAALKKRMAEVERLRAEGKPTIPSTIGLERETNPFLRPASAELRKSLALESADPVEVFAETRRRKDVF